MATKDPGIVSEGSSVVDEHGQQQQDLASSSTTKINHRLNFKLNFNFNLKPDVPRSSTPILASRFVDF